MTASSKQPILSLTFWFAIAGVATISAATFVVMWLISIQEKESILKNSESYAVQVSEHLNQQIFRHFVLPKIKSVQEIDLENESDYKELERIINENVDSFKIEKVVLYNSVGEIFYSTRKSDVGIFMDENPNVISALKNNTSSLLKEASTHFDIGGSSLEHDLLETYTPTSEYDSNLKKTGKIVGVTELYQNGELISQEIQNAQRNIALITVSTMGVLFLTLFFWIWRADTTIKNQQHKIEQHNKTLEQRVETSTQELAHTQEQLVKTSRLAAIGTLSAGIAHDINNPLATITTCAEGLVARSEAPTTKKSLEEIKEYSEIILKNSLFCKNITFKLLNLVKAGKPVIKLTDLVSALQRIVTLSLSRFEDEEIKLTNNFPESLNVNTDEIVVQQIISNLLSNACDHSKMHGHVKLDCHETAENVTISITDNGKGISENDSKHIFEPFYTTRKDGNGMGLAISRHLCKQINAQITFESNENGTTFNLVLKK